MEAQPRPTFEAIQGEIASMLDLAEGEITPEQMTELDAYLDELATREAAKVDGFAAFVRKENARAEFYRAEAKRLAAKAKSAESRIGYLKSRYAEIMQQHRLTEIPGNAYKLRLRMDKVVSVTAMVDTLPAEYVREKLEREANKKAIKEALEQGKEIPGCALAESVSLQIF